MNFRDIQAVMQHLQGFVPCSSCKAKFRQENIFVVATFGYEGIVTAFCEKCRSQSLLEFGLTKVSSPLTRKFINIRSNKVAKVSSNEILDLHNFLKNFKGDLKELFNT